MIVNNVKIVERMFRPCPFCVAVLARVEKAYRQHRPIAGSVGWCATNGLTRWFGARAEEINRK